jgi:ribosomal protein S18 acetylase RimI-like enzyme
VPLIRRAVAGDVPAIVALLDADPTELLLVLTDDGGAEVIGTMQLSFLPGLSRGGAKRAQIEAVRVKDGHRGEGLGEQLIDHALEEARRRNCSLIQLTSDKSRADAIRFYERLGFVASHAGLKLDLPVG